MISACITGFKHALPRACNDRVQLSAVRLVATTPDSGVEVLGHHSNVWKLRGEATVSGTLCAEGQLLASIVERGR